MKYDVIIIGGGPAGVVSAINTKKYYPNKKILLVTDINRGVIPCGIPYIINTLKNCEENELSYSPIVDTGINVETNKIKKIEKDNKKIFTENSSFSYEKLILATGSIPLVPPIKGIDKAGIYPIKKEMNYLKKLRNKIRKSKEIVLIGGGYIGVEFAD